jgi:rhodanese-related sulfurtransferase
MAHLQTLVVATLAFLPTPPGGILVDLRPIAAFSERHLLGSSSIPLAELESRVFELPAPSEDSINLVGADAAELEAAAFLLGERGWKVAGSLDASDAAAWSACLAAGWQEAPPGSVASAPSWRANLFLRGHLHAFRLEAELAAEGASLCATPIALDLGAGNGRDAVFLAEELGVDWRVTAVDNSKGALSRCKQLAERAGVRGRIRTDSRNLRRPGALEGWTDGRVRLVHGSRFLVKALLAPLRDRVLSERGALFVWSTFLEPRLPGEENPAPPFRPSRRLRRAELATVFGPERGWRVLSDTEGELVTRGQSVPACFFAAVRVRTDSGPG